MGKILEKLMKKYWKNVKNTGKVYEKILEKCKNNWKSQGKVREIRQSKKVGTMYNLLRFDMFFSFVHLNLSFNIIIKLVKICKGTNYCYLLLWFELASCVNIADQLIMGKVKKCLHAWYFLQYFKSTAQLQIFPN